MDIVERLRDYAKVGGEPITAALISNAADEIERLRQECESGRRCQGEMLSGLSLSAEEIATAIGPIRVPIKAYWNQPRPKRRWWQFCRR